MATFTRLDDADLTAIAEAFGLGAILRWRSIAAGTINSNYLIDAERGQWFVRVNEGKSEADVVWEGRLVAALAAAGVPAPVPLPGPDGERRLVRHGRLISVFEFHPGVHRHAGEVSIDDAGQLGEVLARIHLAGLALPVAMRRESIYDHAHLRERYRSFQHDPDPGLAEAIALLGDELDWLDRRAALRAAAPLGIIHGDLFRDNVLFDDDRLVGVLDFEQASGGSLTYDLAVAINDWAWAGGVRPAIAAALIAGYERVRPLTAADRAALPIELRASAARFTITRITDVYLPKVANSEKDFRDYLARLRHWRTAELPVPGGPV